MSYGVHCRACNRPIEVEVPCEAHVVECPDCGTETPVPANNGSEITDG